MNLFDTLSGLAIAAEKLRTDIGITDRIMHEINGKIMGSPSQLETKRAWTDLYQDWVPIALSHPIVRDPTARLTKEDVQKTMSTVNKARERALALYARWKSEMQGAFSNTINPTSSGNSGLGGKLLQGAVIGAGILSGVAALKALLPPAPILPPSPVPIAPPAGVPLRITLPATPSMSTGRTFEVTIPPEALRGDGE